MLTTFAESPLSFMMRTPWVALPSLLISSACTLMMIPPSVIIMMSVSAGMTLSPASAPVFSLNTPALTPLPALPWRG